MKEEYNESYKNLKDKLRELFQFDMQDLDFGIYRILSYRNKEIERFIEEDLLKAAEEAFKEYTKINKEELEKEVRELKDRINRDFGEDTIDKDGNAVKHKDAPKVMEYISKYEQLEKLEIAREEINDIFNHIYEFFSRYYDNGDFISKRRYGGKDKYYIPYNGEEVTLYWVNKDQYYIKSTEYFKNYNFKVGSYRINFLLRSASLDVNNVPEKDKYFILSKPDFINIDNEKKEVNIYFEWRSLKDDEKKEMEGKNIQDTLIESANNDIVEAIKSNNILYNTLTKIVDDKNGKTLLEKHLKRYTLKNTTDYFIHKNLKEFLERELEFYIKNEVVDIDSLHNADINIIRAKSKTIYEISKKIIEFLAQIENFQKMLWEKKKFVIDTNYVITLDKIKEYAGEEFLESILDDILNNDKQLKEWQELFDINIKRKEDLVTNNRLDGKEWKKLPIDTKYFSEDFKWRLLTALSKNNSLDDILDGILIKSENFQALNLLLNKYYEKVQTIYIDPPFKTGKDFIYKDNYQTSSWLTLLENRINLAKNFLKNNGSFFIHLDWNANYLGRYLVLQIFPIINEIIWNTNATKDEEAGLFSYKSFSEKYVRQHDTIFQCAFIDNYKFIKLWKPNRNTTNLSIGWLDLISYPKNAERGQRLDDFEFFVERYNNEGELMLQKIEIKEKIFPIGDIWNDIYHFTQSELRTSENVSFDTQKPENLLRRIIQSTTEKGDLVMDFFAGSGTTIIVAQKLKRKWIGVEFADYFNEFYYNDEKKLGLLGRLKIILNGDKEFNILGKKRRSHLSKDINWQGGGFFKYHTLEQYEDSLNNITFIDKEGIQKTLEEFDDYILKYMLEFETRNSPTRLNIEGFKKPFEYKLYVTINGEMKLVNIDLVETFNYLLGLNIEKVGRYKDDNNEYRWIIGKAKDEIIAVIWRNIDKFNDESNLIKDKEFIENNILKDIKPDRVFINGDSLVSKAEPIEPMFKLLMGS